VEHDVIKDWEHNNHVELGVAREELLIRYAALIHEGNKRYNLTGLKSSEEILCKLILGSIEPLLNFIVPRGTKFADIGTGAGIPGIPIAIYFGDAIGALIDSNNKKISFVNQVIHHLNLDNVYALQGRAEELAHKQLRGTFNMVFSRAFGHISIVAELAAAFVVPGGLVYMYSNDRVQDLSEQVIDHIGKFGMKMINPKEYGLHGLKEINLLMEKTGVTNSIYPRKMPAIKRNMIKLVQGTGWLV
jgi:16S rRNA (guanine527-N7)-methyltransferase